MRRVPEVFREQIRLANTISHFADRFFDEMPSLTFHQSNLHRYPDSMQMQFEDSDDEPFQINASPRWTDELGPYGNISQNRRENPHQVQPLNQFQLLGIPEPDFRQAPGRRGDFDLEYDSYSDYTDIYESSMPVNVPAHPPRRRRRTTTTSSSRSNVPRGISNRTTGRVITRPQNRSTQVPPAVQPVSTPPPKPPPPKKTVTLKTRLVTDKDVKDEATCSICLEPFKKGATVAYLKCNHIYHKTCIKPWTDSHTTCPICRADVTD